MDFKKALEAAANGQHYTISNTPQGFTIQADGAEDHRRAMEALQAINRGGSSHLSPTMPQRGNSGAGNAIQLQEAVRKYLLSIEKSAVRKTFTSREKSLRDFVGWKKPKTLLDTITRTDLAEFCQFMLNSNQEKPTIYQKFIHIKQFFTYCQNAGYYTSKDNPAEKQISYTSKDKRHRRKLGFEAFSSEEIQKIVSNLNPEKPYKYWPALIGLYTGARVNEIAQLALKDFITVENLPCFRITDLGQNQRLKNASSERTIPIHPKLLELGLISHVEALKAQGEVRLFPKLSNAINGYGNAISKAFSRHLQDLKIEAETGRKGFHSFRKTVNHQMQSHKIAPDFRAQYLGHDLDDEHYQAYSRKYSVSELAEVIFPALEYA